MDVFHKVLTRIYEITGGRETREVDFIELLKDEGFYSSRDSIKEHLSTEGWITESARPNHIRITHWGLAEAKKAMSGTSSNEQGIEPQMNRLRAAANDFALVLGEFVAKPSAKSIKPAEERLSELNNLIGEIKKQL